MRSANCSGSCSNENPNLVVYASCFETNQRSKRVMEKLGFKPDKMGWVVWLAHLIRSRGRRVLQYRLDRVGFESLFKAVERMRRGGLCLFKSVRRDIARLLMLMMPALFVIVRQETCRAVEIAPLRYSVDAVPGAYVPYAASHPLDRPTKRSQESCFDSQQRVRCAAVL